MIISPAITWYWFHHSDSYEFPLSLNLIEINYWLMFNYHDWINSNAASILPEKLPRRRSLLWTCFQTALKLLWEKWGVRDCWNQLKQRWLDDEIRQLFHRLNVTEQIVKKIVQMKNVSTIELSMLIKLMNKNTTPN